jgi:hypothetical protein
MWVSVLALVLAFNVAPPQRSRDATQDYGITNPDAHSISIVSLLANGAGQEGRAVRLIGVLSLEFEGEELCLDKESLQYSVAYNCIALRALDYQKLGTTVQALRRLQGRYVLVEGVFRTASTGLWDRNSAGGLDPISRVFLWEEE